jgi:PAS domain S-box-containing protein
MVEKPTYEELEQRIRELELSDKNHVIAKEKLYASEKRYRKLVEQSIQGLVIAQDNPMRLSFVSQPLGTIVGYSPEELKAFEPQKLVELIHPEDRGWFFRSFRERLAGNDTPARYECRLLHKTNGIRWVTVDSSCILYNEEPATQAIFVDITERKEAEAGLRANAALMNNLINAIPIPVFYKDRAGIYLGFNNAFETFFGQTQDQLVGKSVYDINPKDLADIYYAKDEELFVGGGIQEYSSQVKNAGGQLRDVLFRKTLHFDVNGEVSGLIGTVLDVTERNMADHERELLIIDLQDALTQVKTLSGLLPICSHCKMIRDDKGYWNQIESYIHEHSEAEFTHGICPDCANEHFGQFMKNRNK